jgi:peptidoglycan/LPS O-acetylase OafA/YrhL
MSQEYKFINFFRASASLWVMAAHCMIWGDWYGIPLPSAKIAVDLFMIISGYLMAANTFHRHESEPLSKKNNRFRFWLRRFFRIAPAYFFSLGLAIITSKYFLQGYQELQKLNPEKWQGIVYNPARIEYTFQNILLHISFLFGLHPKYSFSTFLPDWSLSLEMQFYLVFPALIIIMQRAGFAKTAFYGGALSICTGIYISKFFRYYEPSLIFFKLQYFIVGILVFQVLGVSISKYQKIQLTFFAFFLASIENLYSINKDFISLPTILLLIFTLGWMEISEKSPEWITALVSSKFINFASNTSYAVYLFHGFFISTSGLILSNNLQLLSLQPQIRVAIMFCFVCTFSYLTAHIIYHLIEVPGINLGKKMIKILVPSRAN